MMRTTFILSIPLLVLATSAAIVAQVPPPPTRATTGKAENFIVEEHADGTIVHRTADGKIVRTTRTGRNQGVQVGQPVTGADGRTSYTVAQVYGQAPDPETAKLMQEEAQATQEAQILAANLRAAQSDADKEKTKADLRQKLIAIFDLQQNRRAREVAKIEERLAKLKDTLKKRDAAKDAIVDRRLDQLTGGVDELGWEETFPLGGPNAANSLRYPSDGPYFRPLGVPTVEPPAENVPPPVIRPAPSAAPPAFPVPALPGTAPAAPAAPAAPRISPPATSAPPAAR